MTLCVLFQGTQRIKKQSSYAGSPVRSRPRDSVVSKEENNVTIGNNIKFV